MKKVQEELKLFFYINNLPVLMIILGLMLCYISFNYHNFWSPFFYFFITGLFLFLPFLGRKKLPLARKMLTMVFGIIMLTFLLFCSVDELDIIFLFTGLGGTLFFIKDYFVQRKHFYDIKRNGVDWAVKNKNMQKYLNSKCSRQMFVRTIHHLDKKHTQKTLLTIQQHFGYSWYDFFPDSNRPLFGILFPKIWGKLKKFLIRNKIAI